MSAGFRNEYPSFEIIDLIVWYHFKFTPIQMFDKFMNFMKIQNKQKQQKTTNRKYSNKTCVRNKLDSNEILKPLGFVQNIAKNLRTPRFHFI